MDRTSGERVVTRVDDTTEEDAPQVDFAKEVFTTGEVAKICKCSQQTIIRCFNQGLLKGFRIPGSTHRRIPRESLVRFMKENGIPGVLAGGTTSASDLPDRT